MSTKLTLTIDKHIIENAKKYAKSQKRSLSNLVEEYLKFVTSEKFHLEESELSPITRSLYGSVKLKDHNIDYQKILEDEILKN